MRVEIVGHSYLLAHEDKNLRIVLHRLMFWMAMPMCSFSTIIIIAKIDKYSEKVIIALDLVMSKDVIVQGHCLNSDRENEAFP